MTIIESLIWTLTVVVASCGGLDESAAVTVNEYVPAVLGVPSS
jgi:hypothetical protein